MASLAVGFASILGGAIIVHYGIQNTKSAFASSSTGTTAAPGTGGGVTPSGSDAADVRASAAKWGVPSWILWGVYGLETAHGSNVTTSSAGAIGKMQFLPSTAAGYNYPLTNTPDASQSAQQFDSAAHLLHDLFVQYGSWAEAITHYSGGGYGLSSVQSASGGFQ